MKIAVATDNSQVAQHFGRCSTYTIAEVKDNSVSAKEVIPNPGHEPGFLPGFLSNIGVTCIIAGGMGIRAQNLFTSENIQTILGAEGPVDEVIDKFLAGKLYSTNSLCEHPHGEHSCGE